MVRAPLLALLLAPLGLARADEGMPPAARVAGTTTLGVGLATAASGGIVALTTDKDQLGAGLAVGGGFVALVGGFILLQQLGGGHPGTPADGAALQVTPVGFQVRF